jgi:hypothetical protein
MELFGRPGDPRAAQRSAITLPKWPLPMAKPTLRDYRHYPSHGMRERSADAGQMRIRSTYPAGT